MMGSIEIQVMQLIFCLTHFEVESGNLLIGRTYCTPMLGTLHTFHVIIYSQFVRRLFAIANYKCHLGYQVD